MRAELLRLVVPALVVVGACFPAAHGTTEPPTCEGRKEPVMTAVVYTDGIEGYHWDCVSPCQDGHSRALVFEAKDTETTFADRRRGRDRSTRPIVYECIRDCPAGQVPSPQRTQEQDGERTTYPCVPE